MIGVKRISKILPFLLIPLLAYADSLYIDGKEYIDANVLELSGMDEPAVSPLNAGRFYYDFDADEVKLSVNGNAYKTLQTTVATQEEVDDWVDALINDADSVHTLISITYDDTDNAMDFVVNDDLSLYDNSTSGFITATLTEEQVEDYVGGMLGGTETLISVDYQDATGDIDFIVDDAFLLNDGDTGTGDYDLTSAILMGASPLVLEGATDDASQTTIAVTDPTAARTITIPNSDQTIGTATSLSGNDIVSASNMDWNDMGVELQEWSDDGIVKAALTNGNLHLHANGTGYVAFGYYDGTGGYKFYDGANNEVLTIDNSSNMVFEGATADDYEATLSVTDPTADRTITIPDSDQTIGTATAITDDLIINADLNIDVEAADGDYLQYDLTGDNFTWRSASEVLSDLSLSSNLPNLTDAEVGELENIGTETINATQWGYLGAMSAQPLESEDNDLETDGAANIANTEVFIGTGAGTGNYAALSGDATMTNTGAVSLSTDSVSDNEIDYSTVTLSDFTIDSSAYDFGGATSLELPNASSPTTDAEGEIAWDSDDDMIEVYDGSQSVIVSSKLKTFQMSIFDPDSVQATEDAVPVFAVEAEVFPAGITLVDVGIKTDSSSTYSVNFEEWTSPSDGAPSTIETVATSSSYEAEDDGTLSDSSIAAGSIIYVDLPDTDIDMLQVWGSYYINDS